MFFTSISQMMTESVDLTLVIRKANGQLTVSTLPKANGLRDEAANHIIPLTLTGTPEEMDAEFLQHIMQPIRKATGLISNLMEFEKQADKAAANSKAAKDAKAKETKEEKEKREKYEKHMKKAEELITAKNHKDAITALQQARMYATADKQKEVDEKIAAQKKAMNQGSLFEMMEETPAPAPQVAQPQNVAPQSAQQTTQPQAAPRQMPPQPQQTVPGTACYPVDYRLSRGGGYDPRCPDSLLQGYLRADQERGICPAQRLHPGGCAIRILLCWLQGLVYSE